VILALCMFAVGCASAPPPPPPSQSEVPIRSQEEVARDQSSGGSIVDPAQCATQTPPPGCPKKGASPDVFADTTRGRRLPRMIGH
jgi:hypothetical protein